jgi:hypothetical protein
MGTANIESRKMELISFIISLQKEDAVEAFERMVKRVKKVVPPTGVTQNEALDLAYFARPIRENITIEELMQEQQFTVFDRAGFDQLVKNMDIQEPIEELLAQLTP